MVDWKDSIKWEISTGLSYDGLPFEPKSWSTLSNIYHVTQVIAELQTNTLLAEEMVT